MPTRPASHHASSPSDIALLFGLPLVAVAFGGLGAGLLVFGLVVDSLPLLCLSAACLALAALGLHRLVHTTP